jgi:hypothetical protein
MATTAFDGVGVRPEHDVSKEFDIEKSINPQSHAHPVEVGSDGASNSYTDSEKFQPGVQRVRAITEIWSKSTLISMFILYDFHPLFHTLDM